MGSGVLLTTSELVNAHACSVQVGARGNGVVRPELAKKVMRELLLACQQVWINAQHDFSRLQAVNALDMESGIVLVRKIAPAQISVKDPHAHVLVLHTYWYLPTLTQ